MLNGVAVLFDALYYRTLYTPLPRGSMRLARHSAKKKFAENLVVSKSRCTFALATQKDGSSEVFGDP